MSKATAIAATAIALIIGCILGNRLAGERPRHHYRVAPPAADVERYRIPIDGAPIRGGGAGAAKVTIVEFSDFECPACSRAQPTVHALLQQLGDRARLVWKNLPLDMHPHAQLAAEAALAAGAEGKFWEMHDRLFADQQHLDRDSLERHAAALHLDLARFRRALDAHTYARAVDADRELAARLGVSGTPTFFVDGQRVASWPTDLPALASQAVGSSISRTSDYLALQ